MRLVTEGLNVTRTVEVGDAAHRITQYVDEHGVDLVVVPTHGRGKFRRLLLGSVTSKVLHIPSVPCGPPRIRRRSFPVGSRTSAISSAQLVPVPMRFG